jgi:uncharacterized protein YjlB
MQMPLSRLGDVQFAVLADDGTFPNSRLPLLIYAAAIDPGARDAASAFELLFSSNGWGDSWRNGVYDFHHYHSTAHEVLGVCRGSAGIRLGGPGGIVVRASAGDCLVIPAGVAHCKVDSAQGFLVVGAYPRGQSLDMCYGSDGERPAADGRISRVPLPSLDPVHGKGGPMGSLWKGAASA